MTSVTDLASRPIFLLGMPRSGTTWASQIFESSADFVVRLSPNYSYPLKDLIGDTATAEQWVQQLKASIHTDDPFMTQNWRRDTGELQRFARDAVAAHHLVVKDTRFHDQYLRAMELLPHARCIYLVRHPGAALDSWRRSPEFPDGADFDHEWRSGACRKDRPGEYWGFEDWQKVTARHHELSELMPQRHHIVRYEELVEDREAVTQRLFAFVGCEVPSATSTFLTASGASHDDRAYSVFKHPSVANRWRRTLPAGIAAEITNELQGTPLSRYAS